MPSLCFAPLTGSLIQGHLEDVLSGLWWPLGEGMRVLHWRNTVAIVQW